MGRSRINIEYIPVKFTLSKYSLRRVPSIGIIPSQRPGLPSQKSACIFYKSTKNAIQCDKNLTRNESIGIVRTVYKTYGQSVGKTHYSVANELKLCFHLEFFRRKSLISATVHTKLVIVWRPTASGVFAFELLFPEFYKPRIPPIVLGCEVEEIILKTLYFKC
jgi:hypothetical protein